MVIGPRRLALALLILLGCRGRTGATAPAGPPPSPVATASATAPASAAPPRVERDLLRYEDAPSAVTEPAVGGPPVELAPALEPPPPPPPARLVGFVWRAGTLCAALVLGQEEPDLLCPGEQARGHRLLAVDEERGARLALPGGDELELPAPR